MTRHIIGNWISYIWEIPFSFIISYIAGYCISPPPNVSFLGYYASFVNPTSVFLFFITYIVLLAFTIIINSLINLRRKLKFYKNLYKSLGSLITTAVEKYGLSEIKKGKGIPFEVQKLKIIGEDSIGLVNLAEVILKKGDKMLTEDQRQHLNDLDKSIKTVAFSSIQPAFWVQPALFNYLISNGVKCVSIYKGQVFNDIFYQDLLKNILNNFKDESGSFIRFFIYNNNIYKHDPYFRVILDFHNRFKIPYLLLKKDALINYLLRDDVQHDYLKAVLDWQRKIYNNIHHKKIPLRHMDSKNWSKLPFFLDYVKFDIPMEGSFVWYQNDRMKIDDTACQTECIKAIINIIIINRDKIVVTNRVT